MVRHKGITLATVVGVAASMLTITVLQQMPGGAYARIRAKDSAALIPMWSFFAPRPAIHDYEPLHRFIRCDGQPTPWMHTIEPQKRGLLDNIWAPQRRLRKSIFDMTSDLLPLIQERDVDAIETVPAYTGLRDYVLRLAREREDPEIAAVQFLVTLHGGYDESVDPEILFISKAHQLDKTSPTPPPTAGESPASERGRDGLLL